jgi:predicted RNA binding protein YcfA (HicA-like mRNA interferase family)
VEYAHQIRRIPRDAGYEFERQGKGDHEIRRHRETGKRVTLDVGTRKRHTANKILKGAGLPKAF